MCSIHLDDATAAIVHQNADHTPAYWWRGDTVIQKFGISKIKKKKLWSLLSSSRLYLFDRKYRISINIVKYYCNL